ncbi:hypothetical protein ACH0B6_18800 [Solibacillus silvestris]
MQKKTKLILILLFISFVLNFYLGISSFIKNTYTPNLEDQIILGEMTKMVLENEQYQEIAARENVYAIKQGVSRFKSKQNSKLIFFPVRIIYVREFRMKVGLIQDIVKKNRCYH